METSSIDVFYAKTIIWHTFWSVDWKVAKCAMSHSEYATLFSIEWFPTSSHRVGGFFNILIRKEVVMMVDDYCKLLKVGQCGRSMIEMLGVLAIIGVLSVTGIAGYSKAMTKYKINKTTSQITQIATEILTTFANSKTFSGTDNEYPNEFDTENSGDLELFEALGIIDAKMVVNGNLVHGFGGNLYIYGSERSFAINVRNLSREACIALATNDWGVGSGYFKGLEINAGQMPVVAQDCIYSSDSAGIIEDDVLACVDNDTVALPLSPSVAAKGCTCISNTCVMELAYQY